MAENGNGKKYPTWQWLVGILLIIVFSSAGWILNDTRAEIKDNKAEIRQKVDKSQYDRDIKEVKDNLQTIQNDIKELLKRRK